MGDVKAERRRCCKTVYSCGWGDHRQCQRYEVVERDGKPYCKQHDPEAVAAKAAAKRAARDREWSVERRTRALAAADTARRDALAELAGEHAGWVTDALRNDEINVLIEASREFASHYAAIEATHAAAVAAAGEREGGDGNSE